jgi:hypothetical protein
MGATRLEMAAALPHRSWGDPQEDRSNTRKDIKSQAPPTQLLHDVMPIDPHSQMELPGTRQQMGHRDGHNRP